MSSQKDQLHIPSGLIKRGDGVQVSYLIFSFFNDKRLLAPKYSEYFTWSAPPLLYSWSDSPIGCSTPLYSWSGSLIGSAYYFLYISFCFRLNKSLTNLTSLHQHHLQYTSALSDVAELLNKSRECFVWANICNWSKILQGKKVLLLRPKMWMASCWDLSSRSAIIGSGVVVYGIIDLSLSLSLSLSLTHTHAHTHAHKPWHSSILDLYLSHTLYFSLSLSLYVCVYVCVRESACVSSFVSVCLSLCYFLSVYRCIILSLTFSDCHSIFTLSLSVTKYLFLSLSLSFTFFYSLSVYCYLILSLSFHATLSLFSLRFSLPLSLYLHFFLSIEFTINMVGSGWLKFSIFLIFDRYSSPFSVTNSLSLSLSSQGTPT